VGKRKSVARRGHKEVAMIADYWRNFTRWGDNYTIKQPPQNLGSFRAAKMANRTIQKAPSKMVIARNWKVGKRCQILRYLCGA
jgi:hypothetical protein